MGKRYKRILIVDANYYKDISSHLMVGVKKVLEKYEFKKDELDHIKVTGALEIPQAMNFILPRSIGNITDYLGAIGIGCVIKGETSNYEIVSHLSAKGLMDVSLKYNIPITNGILTVDNYNQALERAMPDKKDRGGHAASALMSLINLNLKINN